MVQQHAFLLKRIHVNLSDNASYYYLDFCHYYIKITFLILFIVNFNY